ncbi:hypothetical protein KKG36_00730, partial [Patescibacteria group bacterium]|nr:hypothetical protein [Patescibacteria group bacterium]
MFNNQKAEIFNSVSSSDFPLFRYAKKASDVCITLFILSVLYLGYSLISRVSFDSALRLNIFFFVLTAVFWEIHLFFENSIKKPQLPKKLADVSREDNLAEFLTLESAKIVSGALKFCRRKKISEVSSINLLYSALSSSFQTKYIFNRLGLEIERVQDLLKNSLEKSARGESTANVFSEDFNSAMSVALATAKARLHERIEARDILVGISGAEFFKQILIEASLKEDDFANLSVWYDYLEKKIENRKQFWSKDNLAMNGSIGKDWAAGYTVTLDQYSTDLTKYIRRWFYKAIIGHEKALERLQEALCRPQMNNALIVGDPGTGRESIIEGLARRVFLGKSLEEINYHRVIELDMSGLLSQVKTEDETTFVLDKIFSEVVSAGNVILVIKDFHNYVGLEINQPGMVDISGILSKYLSIFGFKFVGITDYTGLHERIEKNPALLSMFEKIEVSEITEAETIRILQNRALELEQKYKLFIIYPSIRELVNLAAKYIPNQPFPKKAINILEDVAIYVARSVKAKVVLPEHVA